MREKGGVFDSMTTKLKSLGVPVGERYGVVVFFGLLPHNLFLTIYLLKFTEISDYDSS